MREEAKKRMYEERNCDSNNNAGIISIDAEYSLDEKESKLLLFVLSWLLLLLP